MKKIALFLIALASFVSAQDSEIATAVKAQVSNLSADATSIGPAVVAVVAVIAAIALGIKLIRKA